MEPVPPVPEEGNIEYGEGEYDEGNAGGGDYGGDLPEEGSSFLPPFANEENKELDRYIQASERQLEALEAAIEENSDRINIMEDHLKNVQQELVYTQSRVDSKTKEIETEDHLKLIDERELGRVGLEIAELEKEEIELQDKLNSVQHTIYKGNEKMDQFKLLMNWNQEELEQWALASRQKEEDNLAMEKYKRADEARVKELNLHIEKLTKKVNRKKTELEGEVTETQASQIQLDKTAEDFRRLHDERQNLVRQWEDAVDNMKRRDGDIAAASEAFAHKKMEIREKQANLDEKAKFLEQEKANNKEVEARVQIADRGVGNLRAMLQDETFQVAELNDEVNVLKNTLQKVANELAAQNATNMGLRAEVAERKRKLELARKKYTAVELALREEFSNLDSMEKKTNELHNIHAEELDRVKRGQKEVTDLKELMFKHNQELFGMRTSERDLIAEIAGGQSQNKNLTHKINELDAKVVRQQELLYAAEFNLQQLERKVARAGGERSDEEKRLLNAKIEQLAAVLEEKTSEHSMLSASLKRAEDDLHIARRRNADFSKETAQIKGKINELELESDTTMRSVKALIKDKEDKMVAHDVLRLEVKKLKDLMAVRADEVYGLENRKFQMQLSLEERKHETEVHSEILKAQLHTVQDDMHRATLELRERQLRVQKLAAKYEVMVGKRNNKGDDDEEGEHSQAYFVIKAAQEREQLQRQGDELDAKIRKAEKEVRALEATLSKLNNKNTLYRTSLKPVADQKRLQERGQLREKLDRAYDRMKFKRNEERALQHDLDQIGSRLDNLMGEEGTLTGILEELNNRQGALSQELADQQAKEQRATRKEEKLRTELRANLGATGDDDTVEELDFRLQGLKEDNRMLLSELRLAAQQEPMIAGALEAAGIRLPTGPSNPPSRAGSQASSRASSAGSQASQRSARGMTGTFQQPRQVSFGGMQPRGGQP
mmetsp:Transcript_5128/g.9691  ORF Transcript_5128/g.9691 Transcript_5128/m.9691 type:complete len:950 (+) Transcript_5128:130-2979(+)|eukprot:CAMPEP_0114241922 /NCGR_PEP_ID=MMETSP0058-20121206/9890_1 /TAXON_ID=36894 /ORGANISM="Pyramimonas parkeae, CCMP726" /LENGTH=949 /DNA_ID=CAMNT_0001354479 /DNA_START=79 /DNA_END=2928 /DNA_ORIENTATION=-